MKYGICNEIFKGWRWEKTVGYIAGLGYDGVEIAPFTFANSVNKLTAGTRRKIRKIPEKAGLEIIGLHWLLTSPPGLSISSPDRNLREKTARYIIKLVDFCADIGGKIMVFGSPKQRSIEPPVKYSDVYNYAIDTFSVVVSQAERQGIIICLEPLPRNETNFINTAEEALGLIRDIKSPNFQLHLDVKAMSDEQKPIPAIIKSARKHLVHMHANDPNLLGPGFGDVDYKPIKKALAEIEYKRYLSVEVFLTGPGPEIIARKSMEYLKSIFG